MQYNEKTIEIIEVGAESPFVIEVQDAFAPLGEPNPLLRHTLLAEREVDDQHPISAITGLRDELDSIEKLQIVYSNEKGNADYYEWEDGNQFNEERVGYFVSLCDYVRTIKICTDGDVFGVVVDRAAFVGGQHDINRDKKYGLIAHSGIVGVRCELDVATGDYVIPNDYGIAKKSNGNYGCKVISASDVNGVRCATILLNITIDQFGMMGENVSFLENRMDRAESNITTAINVANEAYYLASNLDDVAKLNAETVKKADDALSKAETALSTSEGLQTVITQSQTISSQAKVIAENAMASAEAARSEAVSVANDALANTSNLRNEFNVMKTDLTPLSEWSNGTSSGVAGFVAKADENSSTIGTLVEWQDGVNSSIVGMRQDASDTKAAIESLVAVDGQLSNNIASIEQKADRNGASINTLVASIDKYSVGEYSQAYGLSLEQAQSILSKGMVYIPTVTHSETYSDELTQEFAVHYSYIWNGTMWNEIPSSVVFSSEEPIGGGTLQYWYVNFDTAPEGYEPYALYAWVDEQWKKVSILDGNVTNRIVSMIRQDTNSIIAEVVNARGGAASLSAKLTDTDSTVNTVASWKDDVSSDVAKIASIEQKANDNSASIGLVVTDGKADGSLIIGAINGESVAKIEADRLDIEGKTLNIKVDATNINGTLTIGQLPSTVAETSDIPTCTSQLENDSKYQTPSGVTTIVDGIVTADYVNALGITANKIVVKDDKDKILLSAGDKNVKIGTWSVDSNSIFFGDTFATAESFICTGSITHMHIGGSEAIHDEPINGWTLKAGNNFGVTNTGALYCSDAYISGTIDTNAGLIGGLTIQEQGITYEPKTETGDYYMRLGTYGGVNNQYFQGINIGSNGYGGFGVNINLEKYSVGISAYNSLTGVSFNIPEEETYGTLNGDWRFTGDVEIANYELDGDYTYKWAMNYKGINMYNGNSWFTLAMDYSTHHSLDFTIYNAQAGAGIVIDSDTTSLLGTWSADSDITITSDAKRKHAIEPIDEKYDVLFDTLQPVRFKYNNGTSDRYHTGFYTENVEDAIDNANLTTQDFAAFVTLNKDTDQEYSGLRYSEFISLNTYQIQKLKARVAELEAKIANMD